MKTALVTGASRGLGLAMASELKALGFFVLTPTRAEMDVGSEASVAGYSAKFPRLDLLINNAAVLSESLEKSMRVNAMGAHFVTQYFWMALAKSKGRVVNISSTEGLIAHFGNRPYSVSKAALNAITRLYAGNNEGVAVNACCPGWFKSRMGGDSAPRTAEDAATTPLWLAVEAPASITGKFFINRSVVPW